MAESSGSRQKCIRSSADTLLPRDHETERWNRDANQSGEV